MSSSGITERIKTWLARPSALALSVVAGALLLSPSLGTGLAADDYLQIAALRGVKTVASPPMRGLDLFRFASGDPGVARGMMDAGQFPWTTDPSVRLAFWRPITVFSHALDQAAWPNSPWLAHAQSLAWMAIAIAGVGFLYRRLLGATWVAGLAALLFAVDQTHAPAVAWIANRNSIIALAFGSLVLTLHHRWRKDAWKPGAWLAPVVLALALLAGESAIAIVAYLVAHALFLDGPTWRARAVAIAPYVAVVVLWSAIYAALGYGAAHSGVYIDPRASPGAFLALLPERMSFLLVGEMAVPWSDVAVLYHYGPPGLTLKMMAVAVGVLAILGVALAPLVKRDPVMRFFAAGMLLAALPICATFPADRLLVFVSIGAMGLVAGAFESLSGCLGRGVVAMLAFVHLVLSPPVDAMRSRSVLTVAAPLDFADQTIPKTPDVAGKTLVLVNAPSDVFGAYVPVMRAVKGEPRPARMRMLASGTSVVTIERVDATSLRAKIANGFLEHDPERMLRSADRPFAAGDAIAIAGMTAHVESVTSDGRPAAVLFQFDLPLEGPSFVWLEWTHDGFAPLRLPAVGETRDLPAHALLPEVLHAMEVEDEKKHR